MIPFAPEIIGDNLAGGSMNWIDPKEVLVGRFAEGAAARRRTVIVSRAANGLIINGLIENVVASAVCEASHCSSPCYLVEFHDLSPPAIHSSGEVMRNVKNYLPSWRHSADSEANARLSKVIGVRIYDANSIHACHTLIPALGISPQFSNPDNRPSSRTDTATRMKPIIVTLRHGDSL